MKISFDQLTQLAVAISGILLFLLIILLGYLSYFIARVRTVSNRFIPDN